MIILRMINILLMNNKLHAHTHIYIHLLYIRIYIIYVLYAQIIFAYIYIIFIFFIINLLVIKKVFSLINADMRGLFKLN